MFTKFPQTILTALALTAASGAVTSAWAQAVTVIEYYNKTLDAYFITGRAGEQQQLDVVADFQRTGMTFQAVAATAITTEMARVCRFYVNTVSPYANSHFYGLESTECEPLLAQNLPGFNWEGYDFAAKQPASGACPSGTTTIYRSFRPAAGGKTANHRYSASAASYSASSSAGYNAEQAAFCATAATDVAVATAADCGTLYYSGVRIAYKSMADDGVTDSWVRTKAMSAITFNGRTAQPIIDQYLTGATSTVLIEDAVDTWTDIGGRSESENGTVESYLVSATVFPRRMSVGQSIDIDRYVAYSPIQNFGSPQQTGILTFVEREVISVATGSYSTCKFQRDIASSYDAVGRIERKRTTLWIAPGVGIIKSRSIETTEDGFGPSYPTKVIDTAVVSVQRL